MKNEFDKEDRKKIGEDIADVEFNYPQLTQGGIIDNLGKDILEVKTKLKNKREARVLFAAEEGHMIILHGFIKKSRKTPAEDHQKAVDRLKEIRSYYDPTKK